jgi:hypothetical protein
MSIFRLAKSTFDFARSRGAIGLFRLARFILRRGTDLYQRRVISGVDLGVALSTAKLLDRLAETLLLGLRRHRDWSDRDEANQP